MLTRMQILTYQESRKELLKISLKIHCLLILLLFWMRIKEEQKINVVME